MTQGCIPRLLTCGEGCWHVGRYLKVGRSHSPSLSPSLSLSPFLSLYLARSLSLSLSLPLFLTHTLSGVQDCVVLECPCGDLTCASHSEPMPPLFPRQVCPTSDQIAFFGSLICSSARRNPATCCTNLLVGDSQKNSSSTSRAPATRSACPLSSRARSLSLRVHQKP